MPSAGLVSPGGCGVLGTLPAPRCRSRPSSDIPSSADPEPEPRLLWLAGVTGWKLPGSLYCCWQLGLGAMLGYARGCRNQKALGKAALGRKPI